MSGGGRSVSRRPCLELVMPTKTKIRENFDANCLDARNFAEMEASTVRTLHCPCKKSRKKSKMKSLFILFNHSLTLEVR